MKPISFDTRIAIGRSAVQNFMKSELYHHGIKGMKWGVRRTPEQLGHPPKKVDKSGGSGKIKNVPFSKQAVKYGPVQAAKSIRSFDKLIALHQDYIKNPNKHVSDWSTLTDKRRRNYIDHWKEEIQNFKDQRAIVVKVQKGD